MKIQNSREKGENMGKKHGLLHWISEIPTKIYCIYFDFVVNKLVEKLEREERLQKEIPQENSKFIESEEINHGNK